MEIFIILYFVIGVFFASASFSEKASIHVVQIADTVGISYIVAQAILCTLVILFWLPFWVYMSLTDDDNDY